ncbi:hypothetical protein EMIHUDRAFT_200536 [Emiliania huxleyi CCMP1516]|uniref:Tryptophan synthase alpha chain n=2 Tax=Emiliania huxleyi TaxID=2903 RepID=A0A0D3KQQ8_EMIH1|nr:hypothetical protein EMIHUDRAFT_200536 [Emiliania huxleyi CCMP1516]EOD38093.1 hypothetical protein EMIHUDRAFT_200536 [Emiliania huxleyi CCMP1516]|eukprot:XP_005790522.1 hypothetical protein EMIHUDRAFT_200536 [Emiliania huxleyi CCMP1516]
MTVGCDGSRITGEDSHDDVALGAEGCCAQAKAKSGSCGYEGCNNINGPGECWNTCGDAAGLCSKCDGTLGTPGACCQKGEADDPPECSWGCNNINGPGECWNTCGDAAGLCSKCDGTLGTPGACCQKGAADDPPECSWVPDTSFLYDGYHTVAQI